MRVSTVRALTASGLSPASASVCSSSPSRCSRNGSRSSGVEADLLEGEAELLAHRRGRVGVGDPAGRPDVVPHRQVRGGAAVGQAAALGQRDPLAAQGAAQLGDQARLAHARLADDPDHLAAALAGVGHGLGQRRQHGLATDEGAEGPRVEAVAAATVPAPARRRGGRSGRCRPRPPALRGARAGWRRRPAGRSPRWPGWPRARPARWSRSAALTVGPIAAGSASGVVAHAPDHDHPAVQAHADPDWRGGVLARQRALGQPPPERRGRPAPPAGRGPRGPPARPSGP